MSARLTIRNACTLLFSCIASLCFISSQAAAQPCAKCAEWNAPQTPFRIYGNTYYVGPHGLSSILLTGPQGHILIDGDLPQSAPLITANIRSLGFRLRDVKLILNSHVHWDHAGGIAELQRLTGAKVVASAWSAAVMTSGIVGRADPQYGETRGIAKVARVTTLRDGQRFRVGPLEITAHLTPGHTPGGTSWTWKSCEQGRCLDMVYADSLSPVSAADFKFTRSKTYPKAIADFQRSFAFLDATPCDILMTPHPDASDFWTRLDAHRKGTKADPLLDPSACRRLADASRTNLQNRIANEAGH